MKESTLEKYLVKEITKLNGLCLKWVAPEQEVYQIELLLCQKEKHIL